MRFIFIGFLLLQISMSVTAQTNTDSTTADTVASHQKNTSIPAFHIQTPDSSWFSKTNLHPKRPTLVLYFSPDCGHCQLETEDVIIKLKELNDLQIVMITSRSFEDMANFAEHYKISRFPAIKIGTDPSRMVTKYYEVKFTPFSALYDRKGKLIKVYEKGIDFDELKMLVK